MIVSSFLVLKIQVMFRKKDDSIKAEKKDSKGFSKFPGAFSGAPCGNSFSQRTPESRE